MRVSYDGTAFHGFEVQPGLVTVQGTLEARCRELLGAGRIVGVSRTDAGVHALGQVVVWQGPCPLPVARVPEVLNHRLPGDLRVHEARRLPPDFDLRRHVRAKQYSYRLWRGPLPVPLWWARWAVAWTDPLDWATLQQAARAFEGEHDFVRFRSAGSSAQTTVRRIYASRWDLEERGLIWRYQVVGSGFLYRMVRRMVGAMLWAAGHGRLDVLEAMLQGRGAPAAMALAPAHGLTLDWIEIDGASHGD